MLLLLLLLLSYDTEQDTRGSHAHIVHLFNKFSELWLLVSGLSTVWEDTYGCAKQYRCYLDIYLMAVLSSVYGILIYLAINKNVH